MAVKTKRIYDEREAGAGYRVLVMRFWPRGVRKDAVDVWEKDLGTPRELIKGWKAGEVRWKEFSQRYRKAIAGEKEKIAELARRAKKEDVTLLCSCEDESRCHRSILKELIERAGKSRKKD